MNVNDNRLRELIEKVSISCENCPLYREVNDYSMLLAISKELNTKILSFAHYDSVGAWGFVEMVSGNISQNYFSEEDDDIEGCVERIKSENGIKNSVTFFREAVQSKDNTWRIVQVRQ